MRSINSCLIKCSVVFLVCFGLFSIITHSVIAQEKKDPWEQAPRSHSLKHPQKNNVNPADLIEIIKQKQKKYVKESYGEAASQCFTDIDLKKFKESNKVRTITEELKKDKRFIKAVSALINKSPDEQQKLMDLAMSTYKPTWAELGEISIKGQTDAGQEAEKLIAEAVVNLIKELLNKK